MGHPLDGCIAKLNRADVHLETLHKAIQGFVNSGAYVVVPEVNYQTGEVSLFGKVLREPPASEWGALIGDVVSNLRSSLDNLVWALTVQEQASQGNAPPPDPIPSRNPWRTVRFPIVKQPTSWSDAEKRNLWGVRPRLITRFKQLQPFSTGKRAPERTRLVILEELWNIDKHRHPHLGVVFVGLQDVRSRWPFAEIAVPQPWDHQFTILSQRRRGPFKDGAKLGSVRESGAVYTTMPNVHVDPLLAFDVAFKKGSPAYGSGVVSTLIRLTKFVRFVVRKFEPEFP